MSWKEVIHLKSSVEGAKSLLNVVPELLEGLTSRSGVESVELITDIVFKTDMAIVLNWCVNGEPHKSLEGLSIAEYMKKFGIINHSVWTRYSLEDIAAKVAE